MGNKKKTGGLTERQERFVVEMATLGNGRQAAINAGYSQKVAGVVACRLLKNPIVVAELHKIKKHDLHRAEITRERVLEELARGLFRDPAGMENAEGFVVTRLRDIPIELRTIIDSFRVFQQFGKDGDIVGQRIEVKLVNKANVIDMAMKHLGAYAAEKHDEKVSFDWGSLFGRSEVIDPVTTKITSIVGEP